MQKQLSLLMDDLEKISNYSLIESFQLFPFLYYKELVILLAYLLHASCGRWCAGNSVGIICYGKTVWFVCKLYINYNLCSVTP